MACVYNTCRACRRLFKAGIRVAYCPSCKHLDDAEFAQIEAFLAKHPFSNALQISAGLHIPPNEILRYVDEGRLSIVDEEEDKINGKR